MSTSALYLVRMDVAHDHETTFNEVYDREHAPNLRGVSAKHIYEAMLTGPQQMPVFSDGVLTPQDKKDIIAYLKKNEETPSYGGFTLGSIGPVSEGLFAWLAGIGTLVMVGIWITAKNTRSTKTLKKGDA